MIYDISPIIRPNLAVFPGDIPFSLRTSMSFASGDHLMLSSIQTTLHVGAHADAPCHYHPEGSDIAECALDLYLGTCAVIESRSNPISLESVVDNKLLYEAPRILFQTFSFKPEVWNNNFSYLTPELIRFLADKGVRLLGIDTPSVDHATSKDLPSHQAIYESRMAILEGLVLSHVPQGIYELIALPLRIACADASPVRAVLRK